MLNIKNSMELNEILAITGAPGLYKYVAQGKGGVIVESLADGRRTMVGGSAKVSALGDIAIFTDENEKPLGEVFQQIFDQNGGKEAELNHKTASPDELRTFMVAVLPNYDQDRVHNSDIKKLIQWYNILVKAGMTSFLPKEEAAAEAEAVAEETEVAAESTAKKVAKPKATASSVAAATKKTAVKQAAPKAAGSKAAASRSTTARKAQ